MEGEPETERVGLAPGHTALGLRRVNLYPSTSSLEREVPAHQLVVREVTPGGGVGVGSSYEHLHLLVWVVQGRELLLLRLVRVRAVASTVTTVSKLGAAGILARAVVVPLTGALGGDQAQGGEEDQTQPGTIQT